RDHAAGGAAGAERQGQRHHGDERAALVGAAERSDRDRVRVQGFRHRGVGRILRRDRNAAAGDRRAVTRHARRAGDAGGEGEARHARLRSRRRHQRRLRARDLRRASAVARGRTEGRNQVLSLSGVLMTLIKRAIELVIFNCRWLLVPFYLGLVVSLLVLMAKFGRNVFEFVVEVRTQSEADVIVGVLGLVDLTLTGNLVLIVIFSGYENFVTKIDAARQENWPDWIAKVDFSGLKHKLLASIVAIASIHVLEAFMYLEKNPDATKLSWMVGIFVVFVVALLLVAIADRIGE